VLHMSLQGNGQDRFSLLRFWVSSQNWVEPSGVESQANRGWGSKSESRLLCLGNLESGSETQTSLLSRCH
jgi:hypothetical protein